MWMLTPVNSVQPVEYLLAHDAVAAAVGGKVQDLSQGQDSVQAREVLQLVKLGVVVE